MLSREETMLIGQAEYQDVIDALCAAGLPTVFTQTGGMNAALEISLDGGYSLLVTDAEHSLAWARAEHVGWTVALYAPLEQYDGDCLEYGVTADSSLAALQCLVQDVLLRGARQR